MPLLVTCADHHFASSVETTSFTVRPPEGKKIDEVKLEITDRAGTVVFKQDWTAATLPANGKYMWDGENNQLPHLTNPDNSTTPQYVNPMGSFYTAKFSAKLLPAAAKEKPPEGMSTTASSGAEQCPLKRKLGPKDNGEEWQNGSEIVRVLYREIKFESITWLDIYKAESRQADGDFPAGASDGHKLMWLNYKLHELGYVGGSEFGYDTGGAVVSPEPNAVLRALYRYAQAHPDLPKVIDFDTLAAGTPGSCLWTWKAAWEALFGDFQNLVQQQMLTPDGDKLIHLITAGDNKRADLVETPNALTDRTKKSRILLDHDICYINKDFGKLDAHAAYDKEFLNPFCWPLVAKVWLLSKSDATATKPGILAPKAIGPLSLDWIVYDLPEDLSPIPPPTEAMLKSKSRGYISHAHRTLAGLPDDPDTPFDNCPVNLGGVRPADPGDMSPYFSAIRNTFAVPSCIPVVFRGSYIGGDNFVVQARLSLNGISFENGIKGDHKELSGLSKCFGDPVLLNPDDDPFVAQTGELIIWRRHHIAREVRWGNTTQPAINWFPIVDNFRAAHIILVPPQDPPIDLVDLLDAEGQRRLLDAVLNTENVRGDDNEKEQIRTEFAVRRAQAAIRRDSVWPFPHRTLTEFEKSALKKGNAATQTPAERLKDFTDYLTLQEKFPSYEYFVDVARQIRREFMKLKKPQGFIVMRARYMPPIDFTTILPPNVLRATSAEQAQFKFVKAIATGMDYGVVLLDSINNEVYNDAFFTSHEISHCLFGSHPHQLMDPDCSVDHDKGDKNCIMTYPGNNGALVYGWGMRTMRETYQFDIGISGTPRADSYGTLAGDFKKIKPENDKEYRFSGTLPALTKALRSVKFTPARGLPATQKIELKINATSPVLAVKDVWPLISGNNLPFSCHRTAADEAGKPFVDATVSAANFKQFEPRFCGKCLLKLRGWKVATVPDTLPLKTVAIPIRPRMRFTNFSVAKGVYKGADGKMYKLFGDAESVGPGWPRGFRHTHKLTWVSSDGDPTSLKDVWTREYVRFRQPTTAPPFCKLQDPDGEFWMPPPSLSSAACNGTEGATSGTDDHSTCHPALICCWPRVAKALIGEQWYQWRRGTDEWQNIEGAAFLIEKSVFKEGTDWIFRFKKTNWAKHNPTPFHFEVHYLIPNPPPVLPASYKDITIDSQCGHTEDDIHKWAKRVVALGE